MSIKYLPSSIFISSTLILHLPLQSCVTQSHDVQLHEQTHQYYTHSPYPHSHIPYIFKQQQKRENGLILWVAQTEPDTESVDLTSVGEISALSI
jgi:hypothetical protein